MEYRPGCERIAASLQALGYAPVASAIGPVATARLRAHLRRGHWVRDQLDRRVAVGERGVPGRGWPEMLTVASPGKPIENVSSGD
jgi:hypothetical protein